MPALRLPRLSSFRAFGNRSFVYLWLGALVSNIGTWMETIALGVYVTETTGRAEWTGGIAALTFLPAAVLAPVGGALADRFDRRLTLALGTLVQTLLAGVLTVLAFTDGLSVPVLGVIAFLNGCAATLASPAFSALLAELVPPEDLHSALSLNSAQFNLGRIIGPVLAAAVLASWGPAWAFLINALSFAAVLVALTGVRPPPRAVARVAESLREGIARGLAVARGDAGISLALGSTLATVLLVAPFIGLVPVFAIRVLGQGAAATSLLVTCQGLGAVSAALAVGTLADLFGRKRVLELGVLLLGPAAIGYWLAPSVEVAAAFMFPLGALYFVVMTGLHLVCQRRVPRELQARMSSLYISVQGIAYAVGLWMQGALADRQGVRPVTVGCAALFLAMVLTLRMWRPNSFDATEAPALAAAEPEPAASAAPASPH